MSSEDVTHEGKHEQCSGPASFLYLRLSTGDVASLLEHKQM